MTAKPNFEVHRLVEEWNRQFGERYFLNQEQVLWNLREQTAMAYALKDVDGIPTMQAPTRLSLWGKIPRGHEAEFVRDLPSRAIGGDEFHFVPGVPIDTEPGRHLAEALRAAGFQGGEVSDLEVNLRDPAVEKIMSAAKSADLREAKSESERIELEEFMAREFPGRWTREYRFWRTRPEAKWIFWLGLRFEERLIGFARVARAPAHAGDFRPAALRLSAHFDSTLGPIGIASSARGLGAGRKLLGGSLEFLRASGALTTCIDWTDVYEFYKSLNPREFRRYWCASRK